MELHYFYLIAVGVLLKSSSQKSLTLFCTHLDSIKLFPLIKTHSECMHASTIKDPNLDQPVPVLVSLVTLDKAPEDLAAL